MSEKATSLALLPRAQQNEMYISESQEMGGHSSALHQNYTRKAILHAMM
jgi:hypothetical protein